MPKLSVISGAYNIGKCYSFPKSIESVLGQSFADFEFIICNDGSADDTANLLAEYASRDERIKIITNEKNLGLAASLNKCIEAATGEYIARHDLDDYNDPDRFKKQFEYMESHPEIAVLGTQVYLFDENGVWGEENFPEKVENKSFLFTSPYKHGSTMMRKSALLSVGCYRVAPETYRTEDYDLFMSLKTMYEGANLGERLYYFCEDKAARKRRKYKYRIDEAKIRRRGFKKLGLLPGGCFYVIKPLIVGLIPTPLLEWMKNRHGRRKKINKKTNSELRND